VIGHDPKDDQEREEAEDMSKQNDSLREREMMCAPDVECNDQEGEGEHQKCHLPISRERRVGIANCNQLLNDSSKLCCT
jgi:hypothetical protein